MLFQKRGEYEDVIYERSKNTLWVTLLILQFCTSQNNFSIRPCITYQGMLHIFNIVVA